MPKVARLRGDSAEYALSENQVQEVLRVCTDPIDKYIIGCQLYLGLRVSELAHIKAEWITQEGDLRIPTQMPCRCAECLRMRGGIWKPKTKSGARTLPISNRINKTMAEMLKVRPQGLGLSRISLWNRTKKVLKSARIEFKGLSNNTGFPHCLRATCFNMLASGGMSAVNLCYFAGWRNIAIGEHYISVAMAKKGARDQARAILG